MSIQASVSVIIACFNSEKVIQKTLEHLQCQIFTKFIDWEIILIDNMSNDNTAQIAQATWDLNPVTNLRIINEPNLGEANARKTGFLAAKFDILNIVDDDNRVPPNWIESISNFFDNPQIGLVGCVGEGDFEETPPTWYEKNKNAFAIGSLYSGNFTDITSDAIVPGAGLSFRRSIYNSLIKNDWKPFLIGRVGNTQSAGADSELCYITRHLGYKIYYSNDLRFKHFTAKNRITWERLERMFEGFGASDVFTLVYRTHYEESTNGKSLKTYLRRQWWFNYLGKNIVNFLKFRNVKGENSQITLMNIRNKAFCANILKNKSNFMNAFRYLDDIKSKAGI